MAIAMDVMRALRAFVADATEDFAVANPDMPRTVFIGWPGRKQIKEGHDKKDGEKGRTLISIFAPEGMERDITKYQASPIPLTPCSRSGYLIDAGDLTDQTRHRQQIRIVENEEAIFSVALKTGIASFVADDTLGVCVGPLVADPAVSYVTVGGESVEGALDALVALFNDPTTGIVVDRPWLVAFRNGSDFVVRFLPGAGGSGISGHLVRRSEILTSRSLTLHSRRSDSLPACSPVFTTGLHLQMGRLRRSSTTTHTFRMKSNSRITGAVK